MSRARPGRARATTAAPSKSTACGRQQSSSFAELLFFCALRGGSAPTGHPRRCSLARRLRLRHPAPTSAAMSVLAASAAPPFLTRSSSLHFRVTAEKWQSDCRKAAVCATVTFSTPCGCFCAKQNNFGRKKPQNNRKKWQKILFVGFIMSTFAPNSGQKTAERMCENEQKRQ